MGKVRNELRLNRQYAPLTWKRGVHEIAARWSDGRGDLYSYTVTVEGRRNMPASDPLLLLGLDLLAQVIKKSVSMKEYD